MKPKLHEIAVNIRKICDEKAVKLDVWAPRELNVNTQADFYSKWCDWDDWQISAELFRFFDERWGEHTVDLFANASNARVDKFYSKFWCSSTSGVNAFAFEWSDDNCWAAPPFHLIPRFLEHFRSFGLMGILVVPVWHSASFWPLVSKTFEYSDMFA